jgi:hypothetical protein
VVCKCPASQVKASVLGAALAKLRDKIRGGLTLERDMRSGVAWWRVKGRKAPVAVPRPAPEPARVAAPVEPVAAPPVAAVAVCDACRQPRGFGPGRCNPCECGGCCDVPEGVPGACPCPRGVP